MTWFVTGFENGGGTLTHEVDLDEALRTIVCELQADDSVGLAGPVSLNEPAVRRLGAILDVDFDPDRATYVLEYFTPWDYDDVGADRRALDRAGVHEGRW